MPGFWRSLPPDFRLRNPLLSPKISLQAKKSPNLETLQPNFKHFIAHIFLLLFVDVGVIENICWRLKLADGLSQSSEAKPAVQDVLQGVRLHAISALSFDHVYLYVVVSNFGVMHQTEVPFPGL